MRFALLVAVVLVVLVAGAADAAPVVTRSRYIAFWFPELANPITGTLHFGINSEGDEPFVFEYPITGSRWFPAVIDTGYRRFMWQYLDRGIPFGGTAQLGEQFCLTNKVRTFVPLHGQLTTQPAEQSGRFFLVEKAQATEFHGEQRTYLRCRVIRQPGERRNIAIG
jgi:hypothetical protein